MNRRLTIIVFSSISALGCGLLAQITFVRPNYAQTSPKTQQIIKQLEALEPEFPTWRPVEGGKTISELREISKSYGVGKIKREAIMPYTDFEKKFMNGGSMPSLDPNRPLLVIEADANAPWERNHERVEKPETTVAMDAKTGQLVHRVIILGKLPDSVMKKPMLTDAEVRKESEAYIKSLQEEDRKRAAEAAQKSPRK
jgi:hypothetical protein